MSAQTFKVSNTLEFRDALKKSALNGEHDTIILNKGIYKTTDNDRGTFFFLDKESYNLTIKSASNLKREDVILDGDNVHQIINFTNKEKSTLYLKNVTLSNANPIFSASVVFTNQNVHMENCDIISKHSLIQNQAIYAFKSLKMSNTNIYTK